MKNKKKIISLTSSKNFKRAYTRGSSYIGKLAVLYLFPNGLNINRVGYSVSKKLGNAVIRNRVKRLFKEVYFSFYETLIDGYDIVFIARKSSVEASLADIKICLNNLLRKSGIFKCYL